MRITAISDLHGHFPQNLPGGDILILAGDLTTNDLVKSWFRFFKWLEKQDYNWKIIVAGNHDNECLRWFSNEESDNLDLTPVDIGDPSIIYLRDSSFIISGIKIFGSPWTPLFAMVNPLCNAFMIPESELYEKFVQFPENLDILVTHGPPWGILDQCPAKGDYRNCGSRALLKAVLDAKPKYHIFGHIHEKGGEVFNNAPTTFMNVSHCDEFYRPRKEIRSFEI